MSAYPPAYVLGGYEAGLAVVRSLGRAGVPVVSVVSTARESARHSRGVTAARLAPDPADATDEYAAALVALADEYGPGVVFPTTDESLEAVAAHHAPLSARLLLACPTDAVARGFLDKRLTDGIALDVGVDVPRTASPTSEAELADAMTELQYPCLVKPRESYRYNRAFGIKMTRVHDADELRAAWRAAHALGIGTMIQELVPGPETGGVNYNVYMVDGEPRVELTSRKLRLSPPDFGYPCAVVTDRVPEVVEPGRRIVRGLGIEGYANVEFKQDERTGGYRLMEVNGRPNMSGQLAIKCGVDFPLITYRHLVHGVVPDPVAWPEGVHWINEFADPRVVRDRRRRGVLPRFGGLAPYWAPHVFATTSVRDPGPVLARVRARVSAGPAPGPAPVRGEVVPH